MPVSDAPVIASTLRQSTIAAAARMVRDADALLIVAGRAWSRNGPAAAPSTPSGGWRGDPDTYLRTQAFHADPQGAWGYHATVRRWAEHLELHDGYRVALRWGQATPGGALLYTTSQLGLWGRAGLGEDMTVEATGSVWYEQCLSNCGHPPFVGHRVDVDEFRRATGPPPQCPRCGGLSRPNTRLRDDTEWDRRRRDEQWRSMVAWLDRRVGRHTLIVEHSGVSTASRRLSERVAADHACRRLILGADGYDTDGEHVVLGGDLVDTILEVDAAAHPDGTGGLSAPTGDLTPPGGPDT